MNVFKTGFLAAVVSFHALAAVASASNVDSAILAKVIVPTATFIEAPIGVVNVMNPVITINGHGNMPFFVEENVDVCALFKMQSMDETYILDYCGPGSPYREDANPGMCDEGRMKKQVMQVNCQLRKDNSTRFDRLTYTQLSISESQTTVQISVPVLEYAGKRHLVSSGSDADVICKSMSYKSAIGTPAVAAIPNPYLDHSMGDLDDSWELTSKGLDTDPIKNRRVVIKNLTCLK